jgi:glycosyltransferase involved in cell wall biosynthesis
VGKAAGGVNKRTVLVSGWRFIPQSYAVVCQYAALELSRRAGIEVLFEDLPYYSPGWRAQDELFGPQLDAALRALAAPAPEARADAELRFGYPADFVRTPRAPRTLVFLTAEALQLPSQHLPPGYSAVQAQQLHDFTVLTCSTWSREGMLRSGLPEDRVVVLPLGFDPSVFRPPAAGERATSRAALGIAEDEFVFFHSSAMTPNKGMRFTFAAFAQLLATHPQASLLLKGSDSLYASRQFIEQQLGQLDPQAAQAVSARLRYVGGSLPFEALAPLYHASDCYISSYLAEGFNMPVLEAAACGLPVICTAGGPTDDFVTDDFALRIESERHPLQMDGATGAMGLLPDHDHLVHLMMCATDDTEFQEQASRAGPAYANANFTWARVVDRLIPLLLEDRST